jgi:hypothetical protein
LYWFAHADNFDKIFSIMKRYFFIAILVIICDSAFGFRIQYGRNITISQPVYEDLYIAGGDVVINAPVYGDLVIAGGTIQINDTIANDILLAGGNVSFNGFVGDDIRCAGGTLHILNNVAGDIVITGGTIIIERDVTIGGLIASGGDVTVDGKIINTAKCTTGKFILNGIVLKDLDCRSGNITINGVIQGNAILAASGKISISDNAVFRSRVTYWSPNKVDFKQSLKNGNVFYDENLKISHARWYYLGFNAFWGLLWYLGMAFLMILIIQYLFSSTMKRAGDTVYNSALRSLGYGFLFCVVVPVIAIIAIVTLIGLPVGIILLLSYIMIVLLATVITSVVAANWLNNLGNTKLRFWKLSFSAFGIFILLKILTLTPFFGWFIMAILALISFGSILLNVHWRGVRQILVRTEAEANY